MLVIANRLETTQLSISRGLVKEVVVNPHMVSSAAVKRNEESLCTDKKRLLREKVRC